MAVSIPGVLDQEDIEKFIKLADPTKSKVDRQDYSPTVANLLVGEGYINDADVVSKLKEVP